jgi:hypothetical protein
LYKGTIKGKVGQFVGSSWKGIDYIKTYTPSGNPRTLFYVFSIPSQVFPEAVYHKSGSDIPLYAGGCGRPSQAWYPSPYAAHIPRAFFFCQVIHADGSL